MKHTSTSSTFGARLRSLAIAPLLLPIALYRRLISPMIAPRCRYYPTCSSYAVEALKAYGPIRGTILALWRLVRCNPFSDGGFDYVEDQRLFRHVCADNHKHHDGVTT